MIKIHGPADAHPARQAKKASTTSAPFHPSEAGASGAARGPAASSAASASMLGALIALQSEDRGRSKTLVAAQRTLDLLDQLQIGLLDGEARDEDLQALAAAARVRAHAGADARLQQIYDEIALRARVELAKRGL